MSGDHRQTRREYEHGVLRRHGLSDDPLDQFDQWLNQALDAGVSDATAMALATADDRGQPSARIVLLKAYDTKGYCWYTDTKSAKGAELRVNPRASLLFYWRELERQVRIGGTVTPLTAAEADDYFASRPSDSRFSAAASQQSQPVADRAALESAVQQLQQQYPDGNVPRPPRWGGYRLLPQAYEFWQGRSGRLHDRFHYALDEQGWHITRLQP